MNANIVPSVDHGLLPVERLTERAAAALTAAEQEAQESQHNYVGQEHMLLGLAQDPSATAALVLAGFGVTSAEVSAAVTTIVGRGATVRRGWGSSTGQLGYTPRALKALELALDEARRMNHYHVGTEHLLLGIAREGTGIGAGILTSLGVSLDKARTETARLASQGPDREPWLRRYQLVLPNDLFLAVQHLADRQDATMQEVLRRFIRLGLLVTRLQETPDTALVVRDKDGERQLVLI